MDEHQMFPLPIEVAVGEVTVLIENNTDQPQETTPEDEGERTK